MQSTLLSRTPTLDQQPSGAPRFRGVSVEHLGLSLMMYHPFSVIHYPLSIIRNTRPLAHVMRPSKRDEVSGLLQSTWSALSSRSRRAAASAENLWKQVNPGSSPGPSPEYLYLMPGWAVKRRQVSVGRRTVKDEGQSLLNVSRGADRPVMPFDLHVSTSGFAVAFRELSAASATQRAVVNIAKRERPRRVGLTDQDSPLCQSSLQRATQAYEMSSQTRGL